MKYLALCAPLLFGIGVAHAASEQTKALSIDFTLSSGGPANGEFLGNLKLKGGSLSGTIVNKSFGYVYSVSPGSSLQAHILNLTCSTTNPATDVISLSGKLNPLTGKGKGTFTESYFNESGPYTAKKTP
jgi:hypothetical protein